MCAIGSIGVSEGRAMRSRIGGRGGTSPTLVLGVPNFVDHGRPVSGQVPPRCTPTCRTDHDESSAREILAKSPPDIDRACRVEHSRSGPEQLHELCREYRCHP